jgi:gamma-glutamyltranspeptidase/glutathione hydrolase
MGVIDGEGRAVSMIQSIYHEFGSGVVLDQSGVNWQNRGASFSLDPGHINTLEPGKKPFHTLIPGLALLNDGRTMVYGNMGGDGQPQSQSAVFTRTVVHGLNPQDAIAAPRWLLGRTWGQSSDSLKLESRFPQATVDALRARGHEVDVLGDFDETFGHAGCVLRHANGCFEGGFDPRSPAWKGPTAGSSTATAAPCPTPAAWPAGPSSWRRTAGAARSRGPARRSVATTRPSYGR